MFPITLDPTRIPILVVGSGPATERRLRALKDAGYEPRYVENVSSPEIFEGTKIVFIADFNEAESQAFYNQAKAAGALVNVEDKTQFCDFHVPAIIRRGDLLMTVATGGASPTMARKIRDVISSTFGPEWADRLREIAEKRRVWKKEGQGFKQLIDSSEKFLAEKKWFSS